MTISSRVQKEFFDDDGNTPHRQLIRIPPKKLPVVVCAEMDGCASTTTTTSTLTATSTSTSTSTATSPYQSPYASPYASPSVAAPSTTTLTSTSTAAAVASRSPSSSTGSPAPSPSSSSSLSSYTSHTEARSFSTGHHRFWTEDEHERFLEALEKYPHGPWKAIADHIGNKTPRQVMSHAQKYRQKIARRKRGLQVARRSKKKPSPDTSKHGGELTTPTPIRPKTRLTAVQKLAAQEHLLQQLHHQQTGSDPHHRSSPSRIKTGPVHRLLQVDTSTACVCTSNKEKVISPSDLLQSPTEVSLSAVTPANCKPSSRWTPLPTVHETASLAVHHRNLVLPSNQPQQQQQQQQQRPMLPNQSAPAALHDKDDHQVILHTVSEFLDSLEIDQLAQQANDLGLGGS